MLTQDLINLFTSRRFVEAARAIKEDPPRLKSVSLSHPVFHLLKEYQSSHSSSYVMAYNQLDESQRQLLWKQMESVLSAMIDAGMNMQMLASLPRSMSNAEEDRSKLGLGRKSGRDGGFETDRATLYVRLAGLGWGRAMEILREKGYVPTAGEVDDAIKNAIRCECGSTLAQLVDVHEIQPSSQKWYFSADLIERLVKWDGVPAPIVSRLMDAYAIPGTYDWVRAAHKSELSDKTAVEWLSLAPGKWKTFHQTLIEQEDAARGGKFPGLWTPLFREFIRTGQFSPLVSEALSDGSIEAWKDQLNCHGKTTLASWLVQGHALQAPPERVADYKGDLPPPTPPQHELRAQLRRTLWLIRQFEKLGSTPRLGDHHQTTEAMAWSSRGFVPGAGLVRRHPQLLELSSIGESAVHTANTVEVALAWESLGASSMVNKEGADPWVAGMQKADTPAPWAREIAARIKKKKIHADAKGRDEVSLAAISTASPPLARLVLKKTGQPPSVEMLKAAIENNQFVLIREWVDAGHLDDNAPLRPPLLAMATRPPSGLSDAATDAWKAVLASIRQRPGKPWPEQVAAWKEISNPNWNYRSISGMLLFEEGLAMLSDWGPNARDFWGQDEKDLLPTLVKQLDCWPQALPIELTQEESVQLFWSAMLQETSGSTQFERTIFAQKVWHHFNNTLPISTAGPSSFQKMHELNESQSSGGFFTLAPGFKEFLEAEELAASSLHFNTRNRTPGRRL